MPLFAAMIPAIAQAGTGLLQSIFSGRRRKEREFERFVNTIKPDSTISDYYQKALQRYDPNAYNSAAYRQGQQQIGANMAAGITAAQDRRGGLSAVSNLNAQANRAALGNIAQAESIQGRNLSQLGSAAGMEAANQRRPQEMRYNLLAMRAGQAATMQNMGLKNLFGGLSNLSQMVGADGQNKTK